MSDARIDASSSLDAVYDGLHGYIALDDLWGHVDGQIRQLLSAPYLERLRRVKQLGFVSQSFLSAEHNRYAHALGTMHIMRGLITRLNQPSMAPDKFWRPILEDIAEVFPFVREIESTLKREALFQHILVAALLQDVGEYPYAKATEYFFRPQEKVKAFLRGKFSFDVTNMTNKDLMTLAIIFDEKEEKYIRGLNPEFLAFLLCGEPHSAAEKIPGLKILRHMLDGAIDADRLDYVYRDTYHALGERGIATPIIDSLLTYDVRGPILKHVRPVTDFLSKRALLWSTVYHAPENRFRIILLRTIFKEYSNKPDLAKAILGGHLFSLDAKNFHHFDDRYIEQMIETLSIRMGDDNTPGDDILPNVEKAIEFLSSRNSNYEYKWVRMEAERDCDLSRNDILPNYFYSDRYSDYLSHSLYDKNSIRLHGSRYKKGDKKIDDGTVSLETCVGPFSEALKSRWSSLPMPGHMAWFQPSDQNDRDDARWKRLENFRTKGKDGDDAELRGQLIINDPMLDGDVGFDTRNDKDCEPPNIFISFRWVDYRTVYRIADALRKRHRRYFNLGGDYIGSGGTIASNSRKAVEEADAVIILYSKSYADRYRSKMADGAIAAEIGAMAARKGRLPIAVLSMDPFASLKNGLPWPQLGYNGGVPAVGGKPLRSASDDDIQRAVADALRYIDDEIAKSRAELTRTGGSRNGVKGPSHG